MTHEFEIYHSGLCYASVCTTLPRSEVEERMNRISPTGIESPWTLSDDPTFKSGETNPCPCHHRSDTHTHYLMQC